MIDTGVKRQVLLHGKVVVEREALRHSNNGRKTLFDALLAPMMPILQDIEQQRRIHGNESLRWLDFVRILVFFFTERCSSRNSLVMALENADPALKLPHAPAMTLTDAFQRFPPTLLRQALSRFIQQIEQPIIPVLILIGDVYAVDGFVQRTKTPKALNFGWLSSRLAQAATNSSPIGSISVPFKSS